MQETVIEPSRRCVTEICSDPEDFAPVICDRPTAMDPPRGGIFAPGPLQPLQVTRVPVCTSGIVVVPTGTVIVPDTGTTVRLATVVGPALFADPQPVAAKPRTASSASEPRHRLAKIRHGLEDLVPDRALNCMLGAISKRITPRTIVHLQLGARFWALATGCVKSHCVAHLSAR